MRLFVLRLFGGVFDEPGILEDLLLSATRGDDFLKFHSGQFGGFPLARREALINAQLCGLSFLERVKLALRITEPFRITPRGAYCRVVEVSRSGNAALQNRLPKPFLIDWLAKGACKPIATHPEHFPRFEKRATACAI